MNTIKIELDLEQKTFKNKTKEVVNMEKKEDLIKLDGNTLTAIGNGEGVRDMGKNKIVIDLEESERLEDEIKKLTQEVKEVRQEIKGGKQGYVEAPDSVNRDAVNLLKLMGNMEDEVDVLLADYLEEDLDTVRELSTDGFYKYFGRFIEDGGLYKVMAIKELSNIKLPLV